MWSSSRPLLRVVVPLATSLSIAAQGRVWTVDDTPGTGADYASIQGAIGAGPVNDGDVLLVKPGTYTSFNYTNGKALTIQADTGGAVNVRPSSGLGATISNLPAGRSIQLRGLAMTQLTLSNCAGTIWIEECEITAEWNGDFDDALTITGSSDVILIRSSARGADGSVNCPYWETNRAGVGLSISTSTVTAYGCRFQGGKGGNHLDFNQVNCFGMSGGAGVRSNSTQDRLFFSDCELAGGGSNYCEYDSVGCFCPHGGAGLDSRGESTLLDSTTTGGPGQPGGTFGCGDAPPGPDVVGTSQFLPGRALRATTSSPVRENGSISLHIEGPPHVPVWLGRSAAPESTRRIGLWRGIVLLDMSFVTGLALVGITDANGILDRTLPVGAFPLGLESFTAFWQLVYMESPRLPGGFKVLREPKEPKVFVLGQGSMIVALDESF